MMRVFLILALMVLAACGRGRVASGPIDPDDVRAEFGFASSVVPICGSDQILGVRIPDVSGPGACGFGDAVRVYAVSGVQLTSAPRMQCRTAQITNRWISDAVQPTLRREGERLRQATVIADYSCRTRNNQPGARLSEHGLGTAIDVSTFTFASGKRLTVEGDWRGSNSGLMRRIFRASCRIWHSAIGPDNDRFHQYHFHFDASRNYGPGTFCR